MVEVAPTSRCWPRSGPRRKPDGTVRSRGTRCGTKCSASGRTTAACVVGRLTIAVGSNVVRARQDQAVARRSGAGQGRACGSIESHPSEALRVSVYAGIDSLSGRRRYPMNRATPSMCLLGGENVRKDAVAKRCGAPPIGPGSRQARCPHSSDTRCALLVDHHAAVPIRLRQREQLAEMRQDRCWCRSVRASDR
jgi:hypothetical protein